jgi:hypothetical protein
VSKLTKIRLRFGGAGVKAGDVVEVDEARASALVADGNATREPVEDAPEPEPAEKSKKG